MSSSIMEGDLHIHVLLISLTCVWQHTVYHNLYQISYSMQHYKCELVTYTYMQDIVMNFWKAACNSIKPTCTTFTPQIKGHSQCIYHQLHWFWNVNEIYALLPMHISHYTWDFIIAEVIKLNQCSMNNSSRIHTSLPSQGIRNIGKKVNPSDVQQTL